MIWNRCSSRLAASPRPTIGRPLSLLLSLLIVATTCACGDRAAAPAPPVLDAAGCTALLALDVPGTSLTLAEWNLPGSGARPLPAHCRLTGVIDRRIGERGVAYGIGFELRLPAEWSKRFYFQGGYGTDGSISPAIGSFVGGSALSLGSAVVSTDAGHAGPGPEFGLDPQARLDYGYNALDRVTRQAKRIIAHVYGREPEHSYLVGCSNGGRQGFVAAQRFPDEFDGIVAGAPAFNVPKASVGQAWNTQAVAEIAVTVDPTGKPYLAATFSDADLGVLVDGVLGACDANDGLADGIVDDLPGCRFDPASVQCAGEKAPACLSAQQVSTLNKIFGGARNSSGETLYSGFPYDGGIGDPSPIGSLRAWMLGNPAVPVNTALNTTLYAGILAFLVVTPPVGTDPFAFMLGFDLDRDVPRIFATSGAYAQSSVEFLSATSTDLSAFRGHGGKLIIYHGASDGAFSVNDTIRWYEELDAANAGRADDFARLFVVPGMGHCAGGPATDVFDIVTPVIDWVENDIAPDRMLATAPSTSTSVFAGRSRPLCPYPQQTRYLGEGSIESAENFTCR